MPARSDRRPGSAPLAGLVLGLAFLGTSWVAGHVGPKSIVETATGPLVDIVDTASLTVPVARAQGASASRPSGNVASRVNDGAVQPDPAWVSRTAARTQIPVVAVRAYGRAAILAAADIPGCHVGWTTMAAIGEVESAHGSVGGASLLPDGRTSTPIVGPALDGQDGVAAIRSDPTGAGWHGDARWEHAVGPMQFLASSWRRFGADADGDRVADPTDIDDAAWGAARHLCAGGLDLRRGPDWTRAVWGYNASNAYVRRVFDVAEGYARSAVRP